ncbi:MAG: CpXC domain-containing protein [Candidatus Muiribacteriota bacterium]
MLIKKEHDIKCPNCGTIMSKELYNIADVRITPEVKDEIFNGKFNVVMCTKCKTEFYCEVPFVYQDLEKNLFVTVFPQAYKSKEAQLKKTAHNVQKQTDLKNDLKKMTFFGIVSFFEFLKQLEK